MGVANCGLMIIMQGPDSAMASHVPSCLLSGWLGLLLGRLFGLYPFSSDGRARFSVSNFVVAELTADGDGTSPLETVLFAQV